MAPRRRRTRGRRCCVVRADAVLARRRTLASSTSVTRRVSKAFEEAVLARAGREATLRRRSFAFSGVCEASVLRVRVSIWRADAWEVRVLGSLERGGGSHAGTEWGHAGQLTYGSAVTPEGESVGQDPSDLHGGAQKEPLRPISEPATAISSASHPPEGFPYSVGLVKGSNLTWALSKNTGCSRLMSVASVASVAFAGLYAGEAMRIESIIIGGVGGPVGGSVRQSLRGWEISSPAGTCRLG